MNAGEIKDFNIKPFIDAANELLVSDEFERAIQLLDNLPAFYRDHPPQEIIDFKCKAYDQWMNLADYVDNPYDMGFDIERSKAIVNGVQRGIIVRDHIKACNDKGETPHLVDMGPGEYWLATGLKAVGLNFTYYGFSLQKKIEHIVKDYLGAVWLDETPKDREVIFNACEIIEHLHNPRYEIYNFYCRKALGAKTVYMSTPLYTFGGGNRKWTEKDQRGNLGHLRAYTPKEFYNEANLMFPEYQFEFIPNEIMMVKGTIKKA